MIDEVDFEACLAMLAKVRALPVDHPQRLAMERAVDGFVKDGKRRRTSERRRKTAAADRALIAQTSMGAADRVEDVSIEAEGVGGTLRRSRQCYVCKAAYFELDAFYQWMCPSCAGFNRERREACADLVGRRALVTGGRVKIGFHVVRMLVRDGAEVVVTTRFPADAARRFAADPVLGQALDRLRIIGIDLRDPRQVVGLTEKLRADGQPLDILINNAAQTVKRPAWTYAQLIEAEAREARLSIDAAPGFQPALPDPGLSAVLSDALVDASGLMVDPSLDNSWTAKVGDIDPAEMLEVQLINAVAPYLLVDGLMPLIKASAFARRYIVNVSAAEGWFAAKYKSGAHPHTNMAKAALNMLTRTSAEDLASQGIYVTSVDTGWITDENPAPTKTRLADQGWRPPLDVLDGAARIYDPIVRGEAGEPPSGVLLKDYREVAW
ncbi:SDR family NAD(P)-dependent oxidoreductase [Kibdelosporangium aridum]|uniref:NAD(P)-dependent dehydrogenase, short-chain alcohol dehydrogenase family n=1 Tax=Kibdelosporangium aridum TaxID=2030 RepID=A0A1W2FYZ4_KIBAR|nr:SDR family NAD(P)-dependent oxidoreductase [Kibdelosporangium aridum]SMD27004.1 NAD(P)-dependent dehydrogenase, short-chain alcohol dehydrogenase family [Kibdelosporangium aridum]